MCGITGLIGNDVNEADIRHMLAVARRRGPEDTRLTRVPNGLFGHAALKFVDIDHNEQPLIDIDGTAIVYNGEIYNWQRLNAAYRLGARNDTQTLLRGLNWVGIDFLREIDGQFAFIAQLNGSASDLVVGRDKWGISPLVFGCNTKRQLCLASTAEAIERAGVRDVKTVPAGTYGMINRNGEIRFDYWWKLPKPDAAAADSIDAREIAARCERNVRARIPQDAGWLFTAMGGIDSQFVTAMVARHTGGNFGGAITVVPWNEANALDVPGSDFPHALATRERLAAEGIRINHHVVQLTPRYIHENIGRLAKLLGPDVFNLSCALAEDLVASTARRLGGKAVMTAGGPDEAGRSYKNWTLMHRNADQEQAWYELGEQFASSEGVRAGLVLGEHGLENRVPLADLIEMTVQMPACDKQVVFDYGDGINPATVKMDDKIFWRRALSGILPASSLAVEKTSIHGSSGALPTMLVVAKSDKEFQAERTEFARRARDRGWNGIVFGNLLALNPYNPLTECQLYALYRWSKVEAERFELGGEYRYGRHIDFAPRFGQEITERIEKPLCYDWKLGKTVKFGL